MKSFREKEIETRKVKETDREIGRETKTRERKNRRKT